MSFRYDHKEKAYISLEKGWQTITKQSDGGYLLTLPGGGRHLFDSAGRLLKVADLNGNELVLTYSDNGNLLKITASTGRWLEFIYDINGNIARITDPLNRTYTYQVDRHGDLVSFSDPPGRTTGYRYDAFHNLTEIRYPDNSVKKVTYDTEQDLMVEESGPGSIKKRFNYDKASLSVSIADSREKTTKIVYAPDFKKQTIIDPLGGKTVREFDDDHLIIRIKDPAGHQRSFNYDDYGNLISITNALGYSTKYSYDTKLKLPVAIVDTLGRRYGMKYDERGNLIALINPEGLMQRLTYNRFGKLKEHINENGHKTRYEYDSNGHLIKVFDNLGNIFEAQYNQTGQIQKRIYPDGTWISFQYSPTDQIASITDSGGRISRFVYDNMDRSIMTIDPEGNKNLNTYDLNGRLTTYEDSLGHKTYFRRDPAGNLIQLFDANGNITRYRYDDMNRLIEKIDAGKNRFKYAFDNMGQLIAATDAKGQTIRYSYNSFGQLINKHYANGSTVTFLYNLAGKITSVQGPNTSLFYTYDSLDRIVSKQDVMLGQKLLYSYDAAGRVTKITGPDDLSIQYAYNGRGSLTAIIDPQGEKTEYIYDKAGRRSGINHPNKTFSQFRYDELGRVSSILHKTNAGKPIKNAKYTYNSNDNRVTAVIDGRQTQKFTYDALNQLIVETTPDGETISYKYDPVGNRLTANGKRRTKYHYDALNRLVKAGNTKYSYDGNGNLIKKVSPKGTTQYSYDADKNLAVVDLSDGRKYVYGYNAYGNRVSKKGPKRKTHYLYDREDVLAEFGYDKKLDKLYLHGPGLDDLAGLVVGKEKFSVHTDVLSSIVALTDRKQEIVSHYEYSAFGEIKPVKETVAIPYLYTGARYDAESGLHHLRSRYYNPKIGRFVSPDNIDIAGGINLYTYVNNNPVNFTDPMGLFRIPPVDWINSMMSPFGLQVSVGVSLGAQGSLFVGAKGGANSQYFNENDPRNDTYIFGGPAGGIGGGAGPSANISLMLKGASWKGWFTSADTPVGGFFWSKNLDILGVDIPLSPTKDFGLHLSGTHYFPLTGEGEIPQGWNPSSSGRDLEGVQSIPPGFQPPATGLSPSLLGSLSIGPAGQTSNCLKEAQGLIDAARGTAQLAESFLNAAITNVQAVRSSAIRANQAANDAKNKATSAGSTRALCENVPPLDSLADIQNQAESVETKAVRLLGEAAAHSNNICLLVKNASRTSDPDSLRNLHSEATTLTEKTKTIINTLSTDINETTGIIQQGDQIKINRTTASQQAGQARSDLLSTLQPLNSAWQEITGLDGKITETQRQIEMSKSEAEKVESLKDSARAAISTCSLAERLRSQISGISPPSQSRVDAVSKNASSAFVGFNQTNSSLLKAQTAAMQVIQGLESCAGMESGEGFIQAANAAIINAKSYLSQINVKKEAAASCTNEIAKLISDAVRKASSDSVDDDLAKAMADLQPYPDGTGRESRTEDGSAMAPEDLAKAFSDSASTTSQLDGKEKPPTIGRDPDSGDVSDLEEQARQKEEQIREEEAIKTQARKKEEEDYDRKWTGIIQAMADLRRQQDEINLEKLKRKQKEGEQLLDAARQRTESILSDSDFQDRLDKMQSEFDAAKRAVDEQIARSRRPSGPGECATDFNYDGFFNFSCTCENYVFDFARGRCVPNKAPSGTGPIVRRTPDKSGLSDVTVNMTPTTLTVWDHGTEDLDRVKISLNRQPVRKNLTLRNARQNITLYLRPGNNTLEVEALNIGDPVIQKQKNLPPGNAAAVEIQGVVSGKRRQEWILMTGDVGTMQIYYQP